MSKLETALGGIAKPGIYRFVSRASTAALSQKATNAGWRLFVIDGNQVHDKASFLAETARAMEFPLYFGKNWDALNDCLTDMEWAPAKGYVVMVEAPEQFMNGAPEDFRVAKEIFESAIDFWAKNDVPFYVILRGKVPDTIPLL